MSRTDSPRLAILGAGPIGLEAALLAATLDLPFTLYERGEVGEHVRHWGHVRLFSPFGQNVTPLGRATLQTEYPRVKLPEDADLLTGREHRSAYLEPLAQTPLIQPHLRAGMQVIAIGRKGFLKEDGAGDPQRARAPFRLLLRAQNGNETFEEADIVLDCTGTYGNPRWLGQGGIPAAGEVAARSAIVGGVDDVLGERSEFFAGHTILVVGAGPSAATTVCLLARLAEDHPDTWVIWLARRPGTQPIRRVVNDPLHERDAVAGRANLLATRGEGNLEFHPGAAIEGVEFAGDDVGFLVTARFGRETRSWEVDRVIGNVGYGPDGPSGCPLYRELQVSECPTTLAPEPQEPGFFVLGAKAHGRGAFLLRDGFEQVSETFRRITGKGDLERAIREARRKK